jgi:hypothetical protein
MILDKEALLSDDQAITASAVSTNVIDLGVSRDIGKGTPVPVLIQVTEDFATLTSLTAVLETSETQNFASSETLATSGAVAAADLVAGAQLGPLYIPTGVQRYIRISYTVAGSDATAGTVTAGVVAAHQQWY